MSDSADNQKMQMYAILFMVVVFPIILIWAQRESEQGKANRLRVEKEVAIQAMREECRRSCVTYGINQDQLIGPTLEHNWTRKGTIDYLFSFRSKASLATLKVHIYANESEINPQQTTFEWSTQ